MDSPEGFGFEERRPVCYVVSKQRDYHDDKTNRFANLWASPRRISMGDEGIGRSGDGGELHGGANLHSHLIREQIDVSPFYFYDVLSIAGCGSMGRSIRKSPFRVNQICHFKKLNSSTMKRTIETGTVALIRKRAEVVGGSARKKMVTALRKQRRRECCLKVPILGAFFELCWKSETIPTHEKDVFQSLESTFVTDTTDEITSLSGSESGKKPSDIVYAMKTIRSEGRSFDKEIQNEVSILRTLDHPNIIRIVETFTYQKQLFLVMELCSG
jgi:serine/threonine protein kinase